MSEADAAYQQGYTRGMQRGREFERQDVVTWLRAAAESRGCRDALRRAADEIERGDAAAHQGERP